jgi:hypothetical protein
MAKIKLIRPSERLSIQENNDLTMTPNFATIHWQDLEYISRCILDYPDIETGGDFFGFWNNLGLPVILYVTGPGENCYRNPSFFRQDLDFLIGVGNKVHAHFGLQHIGSWHSHHKLSLAVPSSHDCTTMINAINNNNLEKFFMILGNITDMGGTTVNGFLFNQQHQINYTETVWNVLQSENVISKAIEDDLQKSLQYTPKTKKSKLQDLKLMTEGKNAVVSLDFEPESWLGSEKGKQELKEVYNWFTKRFTHAKMFITESKNVELKAESVSIIFNYDFPNSFPKIEIEGNLLTIEKGKFEYDNETDILEFITSKVNSYTASEMIINEQKNKI